MMILMTEKQYKILIDVLVFIIIFLLVFIGAEVRVLL